MSFLCVPFVLPSSLRGVVMPQIMKTTAILLAAACVILSACEPCPHYNRLQMAPLAGAGPKKPYGTIKYFRTADEVKRPYDVVGVMSCEGSGAEEAAILKAMLYRAADIGADAVITNTGKIGSEDVTGKSFDVRVGWAALIGGGNNRAYRAEAIRFKDSK